MVAYCQPLASKLIHRRLPLGHGAAGEYHLEAALGQLAAGFQAKAPVRAGDDRKLLANCYQCRTLKDKRSSMIIIHL